MYIKGMYVPGIVEESEEGTNAIDHTWERGKRLILFWQLRQYSFRGQFEDQEPNEFTLFNIFKL